MPWDDEKYERFRRERLEPVLDLLKLVEVRPGLHAIDLGCGTGDVTAMLAEVRDDSTVRAMKPDFAAMKPPCGSAIVTSRSDEPEYDFVCRFFAPAIGINEDPVTGAAHCILGPFWSQRLGKTAMVSHLSSEVAS
jgi:predicted PhzF superfamily epimerase YddE/YHI9